MLPRDERYRSTLSSVPYGVSPRTMPSRDFDVALQQAQYGIQGQDYASYAHSHHNPPAMPMNYSPQHQHNEMALYTNYGANTTQELVRRTNLAVSLANHNVNPRSHVSLVHPMMHTDGRFPVDFQTPKTIEEIKLLDSTQIDRILQDYKIPHDMRSLLNILASSGIHAGIVSSGRLRRAKLQLLFEHLGATRVVEEGGFKKSGR
ncbi:hypothetical protein D8B26_003173 [Coccidioides posadasii str. Silveira]|uniref:Uncharacterized protein n=3 Tax=Coccidioides posadasii TaxID=199306 RepID=E9CZ03_COCPS|nr:hypothetical protein CPC735_006200 [Coccidioides posadasii C735 delta SOWgp]EER26448.1 hypothetical protein CPC735_006200 [Coccidioides posadasii C735 delta SOWgp]EFW20447.1 conserved hypothetical protein [Coccidioides posadasii str. Silveira]KMM72986.1 hypothetical protein CPAG_09275 [Coccidioides posadasii RMSCC 3488]QVM08484.1 hypothetical protein D8B26_003173 [Coccidioides posadasii str. Silveira]|eukprot:XP_003068593.1 hypothetical protein CPC735_006200 [Coccidioides posadasii C735 delta SOWgp]